MKLYIGQMVYYKQTERDLEQKFGFVSAINKDAANLTIFSNGTVTLIRNVTVADSADTAKAGQCWVPETK